jgi:hypothetical protein
MSVDSTIPTSRRMYLSADELEQYASIEITDTEEARNRISKAEEMIDTYVGAQNKFLNYPIYGRPDSATISSLTLRSLDQNKYYDDFFALCEIEITNGTGQGQRLTITHSTKAGVLTLLDNWLSIPDTTSFYQISQLGKFPRVEDVIFYTAQSPSAYNKYIPEQVKRAVAAQLEYMIQMGDNLFKSDKPDMTSESIADYSYSKKTSGGFKSLIAPKAREFLRPFLNRTGEIVV